MTFDNIQPEIWHLYGERYVLYGHPSLIRRITAWGVSDRRGVELMAEYCDRKGRLFAMQISFPSSLYNRIAEVAGLPAKPKREIGEEERKRLVELAAKHSQKGRQAAMQTPRISSDRLRKSTAQGVL